MQLVLAILAVLASAFVAITIFRASQCWLGTVFNVPMWHDRDGALRHRIDSRINTGVEYECPRCGRLFAKTVLKKSVHLHKQINPQRPLARENSKVIKFTLVEREKAS